MEIAKEEFVVGVIVGCFIGNFLLGFISAAIKDWTKK